MPDLTGWSPYKSHVQGGLREGNFLNGQFILICAGPPHYTDLDPDPDNMLVFPIGLTQNIALSQNKAISRIFEIGSDRSYFITGRSVGQLSLGRVVYHGPSLLRAMYAYYSTDGTDPGSYSIDSLTGTVPPTTAMPRFTGGTGGYKDSLHAVRIPPGYGDMFLNLASDLFSQPMGLLLIFKDNEKNTVASVYLDQCYIPQHSIAVDAQGLIVQESVGIQYERMQPIKMTQLSLLNGVFADETGGFSSATDTSSGS